MPRHRGGRRDSASLSSPPDRHNAFGGSDLDIKDIPVTILGPGSQPESVDGKTLLSIGMPSDMATYRKPQVPEPDAVVDLVGAREAMFWLRDTLQAFEETTPPQLANLGALDVENRDLVNQILGEGEIAVKYDGAVQARSQEAVLAGVWRTLYVDDDDRVYCDILEVAGVPHTVRTLEGRSTSAIRLPEGRAASRMNNVLAILSELQAAHERYVETGQPHSINLTLLPLSEDEVEFLDAHLGRGPIDVLSRAYGNCEVTSTATSGIWWVRYYNSMGTLILNSLEVIDVPNVVAAAAEDISDSAGRLVEILEPYWSGFA